MSVHANPDPYDLVPYPGGPHAQTHPASIGAVAWLFGLSQPRERWRVLELGCGPGDNLIPMAYVARDGQFTGVDLAASPVERGNALISRLALDNVRLLRMDVMDFPADAGEFDFIIAHGLYSWVPRPVRERILELCARHLAPLGIAYVSYNAYPGGHLRMMLREMLLHYTRAEDDPLRRIEQARRLLDAIAEADPEDASDRFRGMVRGEAQRLTDIGPALLFHDDLAGVNEPCYFRDFVAAAARHGLQFLAEAELASMNDDFLPPPMRALLDDAGEDVVEREQLRDFLKCRRFRQTLLVRSGVRRAPEPIVERVSELRYASPARTDSPPANLAGDGDVAFSARKDATFTLSHALTKAAVAILGAAYPATRPFPDLIGEALNLLGRRPDGAGDDIDVVRRFLMWGHYSNVVEAYLTAPACAARPGPRPRASACARLQLEEGPIATSLMHRPVRIEDPLTRRLVALLDGTRDRVTLLAALREFGNAGGLPEEIAKSLYGGDSQQALERTLQGIARMGLLEA